MGVRCIVAFAFSSVTVLGRRLDRFDLFPSPKYSTFKSPHILFRYSSDGSFSFLPAYSLAFLLALDFLSKTPNIYSQAQAQTTSVYLYYVHI